MVVQHNLGAMNSNRMLGITTGSLAKSTEKLSSGYKINRAADNAAGLSISEKMRRQIRGLTQASTNAQDGISFCQIADGALNEVHDILKRSEELAVQASNETNMEKDREYLNQEIKALSAELDRIHTTSVFNERRIFTDAGVIPTTDGTIPEEPQVSEDGNYHINVNGIDITFEMVDTSGNRVESPVETKASGTVNSSSVANSNLAKFAVKAAADAVYNLSQNFPTLFSKASTDGIKIGLELKDQQVGGTLATASLSVKPSSTSAVMSYKMWIDTKDYPISKFDSMSDAKKADLASVIAHEMTHLVMYDTVTNTMLGNAPAWFVEGMAQTSSGDNNWLSSELNPSSSDTAIKNYKAQMTTMPYGAGYAACMYLGYVSGGGTVPPSSPSDVTSATIRSGLDSLLSELADGKTLDQAIKTATGGKFTSAADFQSKFTSAGDNDSLKFMQNFLNTRGTSGAGSIFGELNQSEASLFSPATLTDTYGSYSIQRDNKWYSNAYGTGYQIPKNLPGTGEGGGGNDKAGLYLHVGSEKDNYMYLHQFNASADALFGFKEMDVSTVDSAKATIDLVKEADLRVSTIRSYYGAMQNRLEHTVSNLDNVVENTTAAESRIRDTDMATEMVRFSNMNILQQAGQAMLAQANQSNQGILSLLG